MDAVVMTLDLVLGGSLLLGALMVTTRRPRSPWEDLPRTPTRRVLLAIGLSIAGLAVLVGIGMPFLSFFAGAAAFVASAAVLVLVLRSGLRHLWYVPSLLAAASLGIAIAQPLGLRVLALPKAAALPFVPVPAEVVKTYAAGTWFEGIAAGPDGTLYLTANHGLDFSRRDYYRAAHGQVIERRNDGRERTLFETPVGSTAGMVVMASDGMLYMTSHGAAPALWRIDPGVPGLARGRGTRVARLPSGAWPNGLDQGPDGLLYTPDSALGVVWRIDPASGRLERVLADERLRARPFIALAPGANGLRFKGREMFVTVSDRTTVLRYELRSDGRFGEPSQVASGIPGDDFAIGEDGSLFVTTHPYDTLVRIPPRGQATIIGREAQHIVGATAAVFGRTAADRDTLYVVTDGGAFTAGASARGELIALRPYARN